jgi:hypothetical protein
VSRDEPTARQLLAAVDAGDAPRALGLLTADVRFQVDSAEPTPQ